MKITVKKEILVPAKKGGPSEMRYQYYADASDTHRIERKVVTAESDFHNNAFARESFDNGKTWTEWQDVYKDDFTTVPGGERLQSRVPQRTFDPIARRQVSLRLDRLFVNNHHEAYDLLWKGVGGRFFDHSFLDVFDENGNPLYSEMLRYEDGPDGGGLDDAEFLKTNRGYALSVITLAGNGDLLFALSVNMGKACQLLHLDVNEVFPSCPQFSSGVIIVRGAWNPALGRYKLTYSKPIVISDLDSTRGLLEPTIIELPGGRIIVVMRGSSGNYEPWHTRIEEGTPGVKWISWSDDGGKTFTAARPWHFDNGLFVYSSSSISYLFQSLRNGRVYWVGNITEPTMIWENFPRWPLYIAEVNERGFLKHDTLTLIDTKQPNESVHLQLSNFHMLHDRINLDTELYLAKIGQYADDKGHNTYECDTCRYIIDWEE